LQAERQVEWKPIRLSPQGGQCRPDRWPARTKVDSIELLGLAAAVLTTFAFLPQAVKTWRTRSADDFSLPTLLMLVIGVGMWTIYGVMRAAPSVWLGNGITMVLAASILTVKLRRAPPR
jgi:MtN3 and saliva related transmembrane protein